MARWIRLQHALRIGGCAVFLPRLDTERELKKGLEA
jgi:hypothetical protein